MVFRFRLDEPLKKGVRRISETQLSRAKVLLGNNEQVTPEDVHEIRKITKRLRTLLLAIRPVIGNKSYKARYRAIGRIAALLASARDNHVAFETLGKLKAQDIPGSAAPLAALELILLRQAGPGSVTVAEENLTKASRLIKRERRKFSKLSLSRCNRRRLFDGIEGVYAKGERAMRKAYVTDDTEAFHELRKYVQRHWRQMALISRCWPAYFDARIALGRELAQALGDDHDLAVLRGLALDRQRELGSACDEINLIVECSQSGLRAAARPRLAQLFAEKPRAFRKRVEKYWSTGRKIKVREVLASAKANGVDAATTPETASSAPRLASKSPPSPRSQGAH